SGHPKPAASIAPTKRSYAIAAGDVDADGDLDVYLTQYKTAYEHGNMPTPFYDANDGDPAYLLLNNGSGRFSDGTEKAGLAAKRHRRTWSASFTDLDLDHDLDLVVVNDYAGLDYYLNDGRGKFKDLTLRLGDFRFSFGMSHVLGDFNRDGNPDLYMVGMGSTTARRLEAMGTKRTDFPEIDKHRMMLAYGNRLLLGDGAGGMAQSPHNDRVARTGWAWGSTAFDFDNDGDEDIYVGNGNISGKTAQDYCTHFWRHDIYEGNSRSDMSHRKSTADHLPFHRLRIADAKRPLASVLEKLHGENRKNVLIVPALFCADGTTMRALRKVVRGFEDRMTLRWRPGLGGLGS
ncbi:MAG: VCBS repeat-containing protein, partial [Planctomycetota bacterium]|nr:VCBS repeat-containing protein [Planctomycetota bacterium]